MGQEAFPPLPQAAPAPRPPPPAGLQARPFINPLAAKAPAKGKGNAASKAPSQVRSLSFIKRRFIMIHRLPYVLLFAGDMVKIKRLINLFEVFCCPCTCCGTLLTYKALAEGRQPVSQSVSSQHKNALKHRRHLLLAAYVCLIASVVMLGPQKRLGTTSVLLPLLSSK